MLSDDTAELYGDVLFGTGASVETNNNIHGDSVEAPELYDHHDRRARHRHFGRHPHRRCGIDRSLGGVYVSAESAIQLNTALLSGGSDGIMLFEPAILTGTAIVDATDDGSASAGGPITFAAINALTALNDENLTLDAGSDGNVNFSARSAASAGRPP